MLMCLELGEVFLGRYAGYLLGAAGLFVITVVLSFLLIGTVLVLLPRTFFLDSHCRDLWVDRHPIIRLAGCVGKNVLGIALIAIGLFLSLPGVPGQGLLTILVGLVLMDVPGKRKWERKVLANQRIGTYVSRLRARFGRPPFELGEPDDKTICSTTGARTDVPPASPDQTRGRS